MKPKFKKGDHVKFIESIPQNCGECAQYTHCKEVERSGVILSWKAKAVIKIDNMNATSIKEKQPDGSFIEKPYVSDLHVEDYGKPNAIFYNINVNGVNFNECENALTSISDPEYLMDKFIDFLKAKHIEENPQLLDDDIPDAFELWISLLDTEDHIKYGAQYAETYKAL